VLFREPPVLLLERPAALRDPPVLREPALFFAAPPRALLLRLPPLLLRDPAPDERPPFREPPRPPPPRFDSLASDRSSPVVPLLTPRRGIRLLLRATRPAKVAHGSNNSARRCTVVCELRRINSHRMQDCGVTLRAFLEEATCTSAAGGCTRAACAGQAAARATRACRTQRDSGRAGALTPTADASAGTSSRLAGAESE